MDWPVISDRIKALGPYLFVEIDRAKKEQVKRGADIIDFGIGDPDYPTPRFIIKALSESLKNKLTHQYPKDSGNSLYLERIAQWYGDRFDVKLDPGSEILPLIGSKEGITHLPLAFINPGDQVLVPDPGYPAYRSGVLFAGGEPLTLPLYEKNGFLPDWGEVSNRDLSRVKMVYINYPNNPTSAVCDLKFFNETVSFAKKHNIIVCHDNAYSELYEGNNKPISFLKANGSMDVGIEFHSLSKTFNMTGWRIGFVCGNKKVIAALAKIKSNLDSGVFTAIQIAGASALKGSAAVTKKMNKVYRDRRSALVCGLQKLGFDVFTPKATFYVWCRMPSKLAGSMQCCKKLLEECGIVATPGTGFGSFGEGYIRFALTVPVPRIKEALKRMKGVL